jgi:hypothetical protein
MNEYGMGITNGYKAIPMSYYGYKSMSILCPYGHGTRGYPYTWVKMSFLYIPDLAPKNGIG